MCTLNADCFLGTNDQSSPLILRLAMCSLICGGCGSVILVHGSGVVYIHCSLFAEAEREEGSQ